MYIPFGFFSYFHWEFKWEEKNRKNEEKREREILRYHRISEPTMLRFFSESSTMKKMNFVVWKINSTVRPWNLQMEWKNKGLNIKKLNSFFRVKCRAYFDIRKNYYTRTNQRLIKPWEKKTNLRQSYRNLLSAFFGVFILSTRSNTYTEKKSKEWKWGFISHRTRRTVNTKVMINNDSVERWLRLAVPKDNRRRMSNDWLWWLERHRWRRKKSKSRSIELFVHISP